VAHANRRWSNADAAPPTKKDPADWTIRDIAQAWLALSVRLLGGRLKLLLLLLSFDLHTPKDISIDNHEWLQVAMQLAYNMRALVAQLTDPKGGACLCCAWWAGLLTHV
jgi:hypothetical protein